MPKHHFGGKKNEKSEYYCSVCEQYHAFLNADELIKLYNEGRSIRQIGDLLGYSKSRVQGLLSKHKDRIITPRMTSKGKEGLKNGWLGRKAERWGFESIPQMVEWFKFNNPQSLVCCQSSNDINPNVTATHNSGDRRF